MASHDPFPLAAVVMQRSAAPDADAAVQLQNLTQAYAFLVDNGRVAELAELFTDDAEWNGTEHGYGFATGPAAIAASLVTHISPANPMVHLPGPNLLTAVSADEVHGASWCMATRWVDGASRPVNYFHYEDVFRRGADGVWRFHRRHLHRRFH